jgi:rSAM/selenodomain-associated transferase 1
VHPQHDRAVCRLAAGVSGALYVAAKAPRPGICKTRLARAIGDERACALYRAFVRDLAGRLDGAPFPVGWYVTPPDAWVDLVEVVGPSAWVLLQGDGDWTERQRRLFRGAAARGERRVVLIASDSPHLRLETIEDAFAQLGRHDVVLGPVHDGGYYLLGMNGWHDVLDGVAMSTGSVAEEIVARARLGGLSVGRVEPTFDVDEAEDLARLAAEAERRDDLAATRAALTGLAVSA